MENLMSVGSLILNGLGLIATNIVNFFNQLLTLISYLPNWLTIYALGFVVVCILFLFIDR